MENAQRYKRNKTTQTLSYSYSADLSNIWKGGTNDLRNVDVTFQHFSDTNTTKVTLDVTTGLLFGKSAKIEKEFSDKEMDNIPAYIRGQFEQGIKDKKEKIILQKRGEKLPDTVKKISEKAENAVKAYRYYLKQ
ncbi:MAG: hypothetical protein LBH96_07140 [Candidatus Peribacteria bacterium]|nr:hypothetical protein [Candidatus Peribacteria bacterium]